MVPPTATDIFNSLRVPDVIKDLPKFDGNPRLLHEFINNVEEILSLISEIDGTSYGKILLRAIRNKIEGPANEVLNMYGTLLVWADIKTNLISHYSDKRNETSLIRDLHSLKQGNKNVEQFYSEVIEILSTANNHLQIHESNANVVKAKRELYSEMCLSVFLSGLREPLGSTIRAMRPQNLAEALSYCVKEQNISYLKSHNQPISQPASSHKNPKIINNPRPAGPRQNFQYPFRPYHPATYTPFRQFRPPQQAVHQPFQPQQPRLPPPQPMEVDSGNSRIPFRNFQPSRQVTNNFFRPTTATQRFTSKELHNISEQNQPQMYRNYGRNSNLVYSNNLPNTHQQELDQYYAYEQDNDTGSQNEYPSEVDQQEIDDTNFRMNALTNKSDT